MIAKRKNKKIGKAKLTQIKIKFWKNIKLENHATDLKEKTYWKSKALEPLNLLIEHQDEY